MGCFKVIAKFRHSNGNVYTVNYRTVSAISELEAIRNVAQKLQDSDEYTGELLSLSTEDDSAFEAQCLADYNVKSRYWTGD